MLTISPAEVDSLVDQALAMEALADSGVGEQVDGALFEDACADAFFDVAAGARFQHHGFDAFEMQ
jgi:hypothetical protein